MYTNRLLDELEPTEYALLAPHLAEVPMERGAVLADVGKPLPFVYFPIEGVLSLVGVTKGGATVEVADIGCDGVASVSAIFGKHSLPFRVITKIAGRALRLPTDLAARQLRECGEFHQRLLESAEAVISQISQAALCNRYHNAKERLARWLLTTADRARSNELPLTHEFISSMVGGPRSAVTEASAELRDAGAIAYSRGLLLVRSAEQLRRESCECYEAVGTGALGGATFV